MNNIEIERILKEEMIEEIKEELIIYFRSGKINPKFFFEFDDIQLSTLQDVLKIHFILTFEVGEYILGLQKNIRKIRNTTNLEKSLYKSEIKGRIDWHKTFQYRANRLYTDKTQFICDNVNKLYNTKENIILKKALTIINDIIFEDVGMDRFNKEKWYENGELYSKIISQIIKNNVYIKKIDIREVKITNKMIQDVLKHKNQLYSESAKIVKLYQDIMSMDYEHINNLFSNTFIEISSVDDVFELYSIFKYIRKRFSVDNIKYNLMDGSEDHFANVIEANFNYKIYHNRTAFKYLEFNVKIEELQGKHNYLNKKRKIHKMLNDFKSSLGSQKSDSVWRGRPDLLVLKFDNKNKLLAIDIGEIKNTNSKDYMLVGFEELLEYLNFVKILPLYALSYTKINGLLFVNGAITKDIKYCNITVMNSKLLSNKII